LVLQMEPDPEKFMISVTEARKILGNNADDMSDDEIATVIETLELLAKDAITRFRSPTPDK